MSLAVFLALLWRGYVTFCVLGAVVHGSTLSHVV